MSENVLTEFYCVRHHFIITVGLSPKNIFPLVNSISGALELLISWCYSVCCDIIVFGDVANQ